MGIDRAWRLVAGNAQRAGSLRVVTGWERQCQYPILITQQEPGFDELGDSIIELVH